jgi:hypothetical protein
MAFSKATSLPENTSCVPFVPNCHPAIAINAIAPRATKPILDFLNSVTMIENVLNCKMNR